MSHLPLDILAVVQRELVPWQQHNFPNRPAWQPLVGMQEELGELAHAFLKKSQNIRLTENHDENIVDSLADLLVYACDFANACKVDLSSALEKTWAKVKQRDWQKHREDRDDDVSSNLLSMDAKQILSFIEIRRNEHEKFEGDQGISNALTDILIDIHRGKHKVL